jgi:hypothetical protein
MPAVLTNKSTLLCGIAAPASHGGTITPVPAGLPVKLTVGPTAAVVLTKADFAAATVTGCTNPPPSPTSTTKPCTKVVSVDTGEATKLFVNGQPALMAGAVVGKTDGVALGTLNTKAEHEKLFTV